MSEKSRKIKDRQKLLRMLVLGMYDGFAVLLSAFLALFVRFDMSVGAIDTKYLEHALLVVPFTITLTWVVFDFIHLYDSLWEYVSIREVAQTIIGSLIVVAGQTIIMIVVDSYYVPRSYHFMFGIIFIVFTVGGRASYRFLRLMKHSMAVMGNGKSTRILLYGAGNAGRLIIDEINHSKEMSARVYCVLDDNEMKHGQFFRGVMIEGGKEEIAQSVEKYDINQIIIAMPSASKKAQKEIIEACQNTGCEIKILPGIYQMIKGEVSVSKLRNVEVEDLLGREPIKVDMEEIFHYLENKTILVTGGGGSIGSELCRQIAAHHPKRLIIFEVYENNAYDIQLELKRKYPELQLETIIGSVRDSRKIFQVFEDYRPQVVYHAAAHKHVPLMEDSPCEAIKNNVIGTYKTAFAAMTHGCERFVLISTDKAVNPTNIMGASKRLCEMVVQAFDAKIKEGKAYEIPQLFTHLTKDKDINETVQEALKNTKTEFVAVRFGNVLGSNGSVIPLFKQQILEGGPVTVTHPDIIRYFMTIPEAVSLVLQAGTYANGGEIFVLDMGEPVKIADLAENLIRCSGYTPGVDIDIEYTGLRPGEKLYEEKLMAEEGLKKTKNELIHIGCPIPFDIDVFLDQLDDLMEASYKNKSDIRDLVQEVVSTYHPA
ncbi:MAG: polysaccharide biosynthesis protein [Lachnospiraceae bacterium]